MKWNNRNYRTSKPEKFIKQEIDMEDLMRPLGEKIKKGNYWIPVPIAVNVPPVPPISPTPSPTPTNTQTPTQTNTPTLTNTPTQTPTNTGTPTPTPTPSTPVTFHLQAENTDNILAENSDFIDIEN
jgi:hypothetical protein